MGVTINKTYERLRDEYLEWLISGKSALQDIGTVFPMLIPIGKNLERHPVTGQEMLPVPSWHGSDGMFYSCRHLGPDGACQIYERRPALCRAYDPKRCEFCNCRCFGETEEEARARQAPIPVEVISLVPCLQKAKPDVEFPKDLTGEAGPA
jgi:Fe-S-cluster containining protein